MNKMIVIFMIFTIALQNAYAISAKDIMSKNEDIRKLENITSSATLTTGGGNSTERIKKFTWWRKLTADNTHYNTLTRFHQPAEIKNEGILFLEHDQDQNDVLLYLPTYKKVRRVEREQQSSSFMGSEFSYADIATPHVNDFDFKLLKEESCPMSTTIKCWVIESSPINEKTAERTGYSKSHQWVRQDNYMAEVVDHFNREGKLFKKVKATNITEVDRQKHKWMSLEVRVENLFNSKFTTMKFENVIVNQEIADAMFTQQKLSNP